MSWLTDVKPKERRELEKRKEWGYMCGYCHNSFFGDLQQLEDHQNSEKHTMCKGENDKYNKELAKERGLDFAIS